MINEEKTQKEIEDDIVELNQQFSEFIHQKGIVAKFKFAFSNMAESLHKQHEKDKAQINAIKNSDENKEFRNFMHTKGIKSKFHLVIENMKQSAKASSQKVAEDIAKNKFQVNQSIKNSKRINNYSAQDLEKEFNSFLETRGLSNKYVVSITEE